MKVVLICGGQGTRLLDWKSKYDLRSGLKKAIEWFRKNISHYG